ncbi:MAG: class I SAM-dependent methyltransferase [Nonomuraea sp.]|nr:class I SAM-dependent methyltransferase [Nonomuraea sp.]
MRGSALRLAAGRGRGPLLQGDGHALPFRDGTFGTVTALWISTDVDDFADVLAEAARVLRPGGRLLFWGVHPCFNGPHIELLEDRIVIHPTYSTRGWHRPGPWWRDGGIRSRVGMRQVPLSDFLNAFVDAGLAIERVHEPGARPIPTVLAVRAVRAAGR